MYIVYILYAKYEMVRAPASKCNVKTFYKDLVVTFTLYYWQGKINLHVKLQYSLITFELIKCQSKRYSVVDVIQMLNLSVFEMMVGNPRD